MTINLSHVLLVIFFSGIVEAKVCQDQLGPCGTICDERCAWSYKDGHGICDENNVCQCLYECPTMKSCKISIGIYTNGCYSDQCTSDCVSHLQGRGAVEIKGYCFTASPWVSCVCEFKTPGDC